MNPHYHTTLATLRTKVDAISVAVPPNQRQVYLDTIQTLANQSTDSDKWNALHDTLSSNPAAVIPLPLAFQIIEKIRIHDDPNAFHLLDPFETAITNAASDVVDGRSTKQTKESLRKLLHNGRERYNVCGKHAAQSLSEQIVTLAQESYQDASKTGQILSMFTSKPARPAQLSTDDFYNDLMGAVGNVSFTVSRPIFEQYMRDVQAEISQRPQDAARLNAAYKTAEDLLTGNSKFLVLSYADAKKAFEHLASLEGRKSDRIHNAERALCAAFNPTPKDLGLKPQQKTQKRKALNAAVSSLADAFFNKNTSPHLTTDEVSANALATFIGDAAQSIRTEQIAAMNPRTTGTP
jgi:hypothetical protein